MKKLNKFFLFQMFISVPASREVLALKSEVSEAKISEARFFGVNYKGNFYDWNGAILHIGTLAFVYDGRKNVSHQMKFFEKWDFNYKFLWAQSEYIYARDDNRFYALDFKNKYYLGLDTTSRLLDHIAYRNKNNILYNIYPWRYRDFLRGYLTRDQKRIAKTANLILRRFRVPKYVRIMILELAF